MNAEQRQALLGAIATSQDAAAMLQAGDVYSLRSWVVSAAGQAALRGAGLVRIQQPCHVGEGRVTELLGDPGGPVFVYGLQRAATAVLPDDAGIDQVAMHARFVQAWRLLQSGTLDVGLKVTREAFAAAVGALPGFTQQVCDALLSVAETVEPVEDEDLSVLVPEPEGNEALRRGDD